MVFDRWGGCYLYSGVYLMYVSEGAKNGLRPYVLKPVLVEATSVSQPHNPGDGLIQRLSVKGPAVESPESGALRALMLRAATDFSKGHARFGVGFRNEGFGTIKLRRDEGGFTVLARKPQACPVWVAPSDGPSFALITRVSFGLYPEPVVAGHGEGCGITYRCTLQEALPYELEIPGHSGYEAVLTLALPPGEYEFLVGYGSGVHAARPIVSNAGSFDVSPSGIALLIREQPK